MNILEIILIGIALAMDASALTVANCTTYSRTLNKKKEGEMLLTFAFFQFIMPVIGYYIGSIFSGLIEKVAGFITAGVFFLLSLKIVIDIVKENKEKENNNKKQKDTELKYTYATVFVQGIATSIDALIVGVTFSATLNYSIFIASSVIFAVTLLLCFLALLLGKSLGKLFGKYAEWIGAIILFALAVKNLVGAIV